MRLRTLPPLAVVVVLAIPSVASADFQHTVVAGESLTSVAAADGLSVDQLAAENGLSSDAQLVVGQTLSIPPQDGSGAASSSPGASSDTGSASSSDSASSSSSDSSGSSSSDSSGWSSSDSSGSSSSDVSGDSTSSSSAGGYVVQPGDTLSEIAAANGMSASELAAINGLDVNGVLRDGTVLEISTASSGSGPSSSSDSSSSSLDSSGSADSSSSSSDSSVGQVGADVPPYPTAEHVSASEVGSIADAGGVPASLAEAVGWQESGFDNSLVSSADARGVMQIIPGTWDYIQRNLTGGVPLAPASAASNVRGGVLLLHALLSATGGDPAMAAAGYYQGLSSVRQNGVYSDTQQYVDSVLALRQRFGGP
jgi:N-acetylmuramoyl-L-alanine amidase